MFERENLKRVNFNVEPTKWEDFKTIAKLNQRKYFFFQNI